MKSLVLLISICYSLFSFSQEIIPAERLILDDTLVFMGIDWSQARFINPEDAGKSIYIRDRHGPYWGIIDDFMCKHSNLKFDFDKHNVICRATLFDSSYTQLDSNWIVPKYDGITYSQIAQHTKTYPKIGGNKVGIVFIIDELNKTKDMLVMYGVYIDLSDNSVIKVIKAIGAPTGFGYSMFWANAVDSAYAAFTISDQNYLHRIRHYFKKHP